MLRILIADSHPILRRGIRVLVEQHCRWTVCGEAADGAEALALALREMPDLVILDTGLSSLDGLALVARLRAACPRTNLLIFTKESDDATVRRCLSAGVRGYILKSDGEEALASAISAVGANRPSFSSVVSELLLSSVTSKGSRDRLESFTEREREIGRLMADGKSNSEMAGLFGISVKTVESHRSAAMRKAGVTSAAQFVRFAVKQNLISA